MILCRYKILTRKDFVVKRNKKLSMIYIRSKLCNEEVVFDFAVYVRVVLYIADSLINEYHAVC